MHEIRLVGRGGQGVVTAGELLGKAALLEGRWAQAIPTFGPERRGALSSCTLRVDDEEILLKFSATRPQIIVFLDPTIWYTQDVISALRPGGTLVFNTGDAPERVQQDLDAAKHGYRPRLERHTLYTVDATAIALSHLGRPITNTAMMGALAGATGLIALASIETVLQQRFGERAQGNIASARAAAAGLRRLNRQDAEVGGQGARAPQAGG